MINTNKEIVIIFAGKEKKIIFLIKYLNQLQLQLLLI